MVGATSLWWKVGPVVVQVIIEAHLNASSNPPSRPAGHDAHADHVGQRQQFHECGRVIQQ